MSPYTLAIAISAISIASFAIGIYILYRDWPYFAMRKTSGLNNDYIATDYFSGLMEIAEHKISISDHGNIMKESVYQNEDVIEITEKKLENNPNFIIECGFTSKDKNKFRETFENHPRVHIVQRKEPNLEYPHYKIIDNGKEAYLSRHDLGSNNRMVQYYDFSKVKVRCGQTDVQDEYIGEYLRDIEVTFKRKP